MSSDDLLRLAVERERFSAAVLSPNTMKSYSDSWVRFLAWCKAARRATLPATDDTAVLWATSMLTAGLTVASVESRLSGVAYYHRAAGHPAPGGVELRRVLNGARRLRHERPRQKLALTIDQLWRISRVLDTERPHGLRDRALFVLGFAGAFRRSELRALDVQDLELKPKGLLVHLRRSKTDQVGAGRDVGIFRGERADTCPVRTVRAWLDCRGRHGGPLFVAILGRDDVTQNRLSLDSVGQVIRRGVERIGLDPALYSGHSLRSGYVTAAAENGASEMAVMRQTGHKSVAMVHRYFRPVLAFAGNPLQDLL